MTMLRFGGDGNEVQLREVDTVTTRAAWQECKEYMVVAVEEDKDCNNVSRRRRWWRRGGKNNGGVLKLWYQFLRSYHNYLLIPPKLKEPCPQTLVSVAPVE